MARISSLSILLVEDDPDIQELEKYILESLGYFVKTACNGREAITHLNSGAAPNLILLDLMMPDMNGWEFLKERAHHPHLRAIPLVIVSAVGDASSSASRLADRVLTKPFSFECFVTTVRSLCKTQTSPPDA